MKNRPLLYWTKFLLVAVYVFFSCNKKPNPEVGFIGTVEKGDANARMTNIQGAAEYEFNLLKNPVTGEIPSGVREAELLQARSVMTTPRGGMQADLNPYTFQGPNNLGGRTRALEYDVRFNGTSNQVIMAGGISGGVFKSIDNGTSWTRKSSTSDLFNVSTLAQDPRTGEEDTWFYAGGEFIGNSTNAPGATYRGKGIYKSVDNGETWTFLPNSNLGVYEIFDQQNDYISKIVVDPTNGNVYAASVDAVYRSNDGGTNWSVVLSSGSGSISSNFITDIAVTSGGRLFASFSGFCPTAPTNTPGVWTSTSGNSGSWTKIAGTGAATSPAGWNGDGAYGRVVMAVAPSNQNLLYALYYSADNNCTPGVPEAEFFKWDQSASIWTPLTVANETGCSVGNDPFSVQTGYDLVVEVKPDDENTVFIGGTNIYRSTNGGTTVAGWVRIGGYNSPANYALYPNSHPDIHAIAFQPGAPDIMLCGNDGGIQRTANNLAGTVSWTQINTGYRTYQYYYVDIDPRTGVSKVIGGAQDNGTTRNIGGSGSDFESVVGGDGVSVALSGTSLLEYCGAQLGSIYRRAEGLPLGSGTVITPTGESNSGLFVTLFKLDPDNPEHLYYANDEALYRTISASTVTSGSWTNLTGISATIPGTTNDITALALSRGTYSPTNTSLFLGTSNGLVYRLDDPANSAAATVPVNITGGSFPVGNVSGIAVNPRNDDTVVVTFSNYGVLSVFWTGNANSASPTWTNVEGNISSSSFRSVAIHSIPNSPQVRYFVGTSTGLYTNIGLPGITTWTKEGASDIGNAVVTHLAYRHSDGFLLAGTHGFGMWSTMLNLSPLPVEFTSFTGILQNQNARLKWTTAAEYNSKHFELERSLNGISFEKISTVTAAGISNSPTHYSFLDRGPLTENNFYRLKCVDLDGTTKISNTVLVKLTSASQEMFVLGNPFGETIHVKFRKPAEAMGELSLLDVKGTLQARESIAPGDQVIDFEISSDLKAGVYFLKAVIGDLALIRKVIKR
jgi:photosystem II stability/assembly factor-like uncharacterized protein